MLKIWGPEGPDAEGLEAMGQPGWNSVLQLVKYANQGVWENCRLTPETVRRKNTVDQDLEDQRWRQPGY